MKEDVLIIVSEQQIQLKKLIFSLLDNCIQFQFDGSGLVQQLVLKSEQGPTSTLTMRYSELMKRWELETENLFVNGNVYDLYYPIFQVIAERLNVFNRQAQINGFSL